MQPQHPRMNPNIERRLLVVLDHGLRITFGRDAIAGIGMRLEEGREVKHRFAQFCVHCDGQPRLINLVTAVAVASLALSRSRCRGGEVKRW